MTPTVLDRPVPPRVPSSRQPPRGPAPRRPRDPSWLLPAGLTASVLIHLVAFLVFRFDLRVTTVSPDDVRAQRLLALQPAMQVVDVRPVATPEVPRVATPETVRPEPAPFAPAITTTPVQPPVSAEPPLVRPGAERDPDLLNRVRPKGTDPRLWVPPPPPDALDETTRALLPLYATLDAWNDSTQAAALRAAKATDWTTTDANGNRWGISPGQIHLGKITLPLPFGFAPPPGRRDEIAGRVRSWGEIQRQAADADARATIAERAKAIRERKAAERRDTTVTTRKN
jgi:hypothetical protein